MRKLRYPEVKLSAQLLSEFEKKRWGRAKGKQVFWPFGVQLCSHVSPLLELCLALMKPGHGMGLTRLLRGPV